MEKKLPSSHDVAMRGTTLISVLAFFYHAVFLVVFLLIGVKPMFFFNIGSVILFAVCTHLVVGPKMIVLPFFLSLAEVMAHQILADYYIGVEAGFHFFMLVLVSSAFIVLRDHKRIALIFCLIPMVGFVVMEMLRSFLVPVYKINPTYLHLIHFVNVVSFVFMIVYWIYEFSNASYKLEFALMNRVSELAKKMQKKNEEIINIQDQTIFSLSNLVENRDRDTGMHIQRTSAYVKMLAEEARKEGLYEDYLTDDAISLLARGAPMHDIGKIVVSDSILKKPGKLTEDEFKEMQRHASEGGRIINEIFGEIGDPEYLTVAYEIATGHHEKWNGTGYPSGKKGTDIPLSARIMALADVFDALVSVRCYKDPMGIDKAFEIIEKDSGSHFDPDLARIFIKNRDKVLEIMSRLRD